MTQSSKPRLRVSRHVPLHIVLCCVLAAFLAGRYLSRVSSRDAPADINVQPDLSELWQQQCLQQSGILQQRPPLKPAASGNPHYTLAPYQVLSWYPRIVVYPNFIDEARADAIIQLAQGHLQLSTVQAEGVPGEYNERVQGRSSSGAFITESDDTSGSLTWLARKIQDMTLLHVTHGEEFYVIRYKAGEKYDPHVDPHDESESQRNKRIATVVVYLNDVASGGETSFPKEGRDGGDRQLGPNPCSHHQGLVYKPRKGDAVLFWSTTPDLSLDPRSLHAGCAVGRGSEKWVVTKWLRDKPVYVAGGFGFAT